MAVLALVVATVRAYSSDNARPAALTSLCGFPLVVHAVRGLRESGVVDRIVVLARPSEVDDIGAVLPAGAAVVVGRPPLDVEPEVLLAHDVTRARTPVELVRRVVVAVRAGADAVTPALPCSDTVKRVDSAGLVIDTPDRTGLRVLQTPRGWSANHAGPVLRMLDSAEPVVPVTDTMRVVPGHPDARDINSPFELAVAEMIGSAGVTG
ncbi:MAG TPA: 2-C-methyl-D-erythritol 4-phosphate cytidylyltransferase [Pseudonocardiaceae bacterium]|jgi:2-C-methyl-D-erythritol 4-phosphate cytidylyltransferase|nr:2-C-methyl-D-erythritol 4-phosphate cytidylyltransferase [Pseudonocardiaceae bacterium]